MVKKANLSGMSLPGHINFSTEEGGNVDVDTDDYEDKPNYSKSKIISIYHYTKKIPFIRGVSVILDMIISMIHYFIKKLVHLFIIVFFGIYILFSPARTIEPFNNTFWDNYIILGLYLFIFLYVFLATKNHAAEHKCIAAYDKNTDLSYANILTQPKENRRCGTVLMVWFLIFSIPFIFIFTDVNDFIQILSSFSIGFEAFLLARRDDIIGKIMYTPGWLGQKLTTRNPDKKRILRAREGLMFLLDKEGYTYRK